MRTPDFLSIEIGIVGGSICGLSAAIALSRAGHKVTVFDQVNPLVAQHYIDGGCRLPPNATKVWYRWGIEQRLRTCSVKSTGMMYAQYDSGSVVGSHEWEEEVLEETGGDFLLMHFSDLRRILGESALEHGATLRCSESNKVASVQPDRERPTLTLVTGELHTFDVIIFADGCILPGWLGRPTLLKPFGKEDNYEVTGMQLFNVLVPEKAMDEIEDKVLLEQLRTSGKVFTWFGPQYGAMGYPVAPTTADPLFTLYVYAPRHDDKIGSYTSDIEELMSVIKNADPRLTTLATHASQVSCIPNISRPSLEEWIHPDGRVMCIGECAHPIDVVGSVYAIGMSAGDAAVLGRVFSHLHRKEQIDTFLGAVQEIRQARVEDVKTTAARNVFAVSLPPGVTDSARGEDVRTGSDKGLEALTHGNAESQASEAMIEAIERIFAYDPEDEADNWWVEWGVMQERASRWHISDEFTVVVEEREDENSS